MEERSVALPCNIGAESVVLGSIMLDDRRFPSIGDVLTSDDFMLEKHKRIFAAMGALNNRGETIDYITVANELQSHGQLESCDGVTYLVSLNDVLPRIENLDSYVRILQEKAIRRRGVHAAQNLMNRFLLEDDPTGEILQACQKAVDTLSDGINQHNGWTTPYEIIMNYPGGPHGFIERPKGGSGIPTPWPDLTENLGGGLHKGELVIVAGRPSMGKSIVGMQIAHHAALKGHGAAFFSLEMSGQSLTERLLCGLARVDYQRFRAGYCNVMEMNKLRCAAADLKQPHIDDSRARTIPAITAALRRLTIKQPVEVVLIDHLQLMRSTGREQSRHHELSNICHDLKHEAGRLGVVVVLISQLNRECEIENRRPQLSDLKETGSLEEDGDVVLFVHRPERYAKNHGNEELRGRAEFIIAKQRNGPTGTTQMIFRDSHQRFENSAT